MSHFKKDRSVIPEGPVIYNWREAPSGNLNTFQSPFRTLTIISLAIFVSELLVMIVLRFLPVFSVWPEALLERLMGDENLMRPFGFLEDIPPRSKF